jgi:hypothetical protein
MITAQTTLAGHLIEWFFFPLAVLLTPPLVIGGVKAFRKIDQVWVDFVGQPARPGVKRRPGVMERLADLEDVRTMVADVHHELAENSGSTVRDKVDQINTAVGGHPQSE